MLCRELCKTAEPMDLSFGLWTQMELRKQAVAHWRHLANNIEPSMCGGDTAFWSNYFDYLLLFTRLCHRPSNNTDTVRQYYQFLTLICIVLQLSWSPYGIGQTIIFLPCGFFFLSSSFFSSRNLSGQRLDVRHTSTHGVALVRL